MSDTISAALASAVASILAAVLSRGVETRTRSRHRLSSSAGPLTPVISGARWWYIAFVIFLIWFALSPALVNHDFAGTNFFLIPFAAILLALMVPTLPLKAASISLALFAANFFLGPLSNRIGGSEYDPWESSQQLTLLLIGFGSAGVASCICYLRLRFRKRSVAATTPMQRVTLPPARSQPRSQSGLARELERLAKLHATHRLSDDEFQREKEKLLGFN